MRGVQHVRTLAAEESEIRVGRLLGHVVLRSSLVPDQARVEHLGCYMPDRSDVATVAQRVSIRIMTLCRYGVQSRRMDYN